MPCAGVAPFGAAVIELHTVDDASLPMARHTRRHGGAAAATILQLVIIESHSARLPQTRRAVVAYRLRNPALFREWRSRRGWDLCTQIVRERRVCDRRDRRDVIGGCLAPASTRVQRVPAARGAAQRCFQLLLEPVTRPPWRRAAQCCASC